MDIVSMVSKIAHRTFEVPATRTRNGVETQIKVVVHQDLQDIAPGPQGDMLVQRDMLSVRTEYDLQQNDLVAITDRSAVSKDVIFVVTGRSAESGDGHITLWSVRLQNP